LHVEDAKFFSLILNPSGKEAAKLGSTREEKMKSLGIMVDRMMDRMRKYGWRYDSSMRRIAKSLAPQVAEGDLKPVKGERVRRTRKANAR